MNLSNIKGLVIDLDGCVYVGKTPIEGAAEALEKLREMGYKLLFLTNNSTKTRLEYSKKLASMGIKADPEEILTSGVIAARYLASISTSTPKVFPITEEGFTEEAKMLGIKILNMDDWEEAEYVVVGLDRRLTYEKLSIAVRLINRGAKFICTNIDHIYPSDRGFEPGAGSIAAAIERATGVEPLVVGKPYEEAIRQVFNSLKLGPREVAFVGDRIDTDMRIAKAAGSIGIMVMTGAAKLFKIEEAEYRPDYVIESIAHLPCLLTKSP